MTFSSKELTSGTFGFVSNQKKVYSGEENQDLNRYRY